MKAILREKKLILSENKLWLLEELSAASINQALELVNKAIANFNASDPNNAKSLKKALDDFQHTLTVTRTTANSTSDFSAVESAFRKFWSEVKKSNILDLDVNNLEKSDNISIALKPLKNTIKLADEIYNTTDLVVPNEAGKEVNNKLLLKTSLELVRGFDPVISEMSSNSDLGAKTITDKANLNFIKRSLEIFSQSFSSLSIPENKAQLEKVINLITPENLASKDGLTRIVFEFKQTNDIIKNSSDRTRQDAKKAEADKKQDWDELYRTAADKNAFWDKYFKEYWGPNASKVISLGSAFKLECKAYGFSEKLNPFIKYLDYVFENNFNINGAQYQVIHNLVADDKLKAHQLDPKINKNRLVIFYSELFNYSPDEVRSYINYNITILKILPSAEEALEFMLVTPKKINSKLYTLEAIRRGFFEKYDVDLESTNVRTVDSNSVQKAIKEISAGKKDDVGKMLIALNYTYVNSDDLSDKIRNTFGMDENNINLADTKKYNKSFIDSYGEPNTKVAEEIIGAVINNWANKTTV